MYISTKIFENYSVALKQHKAKHSHCHLLHGYHFKFKVWFASNEFDEEKQLDDMNIFQNLKLLILALFNIKKINVCIYDHLLN
jgi:hypothetical protein